MSPQLSAYERYVRAVNAAQLALAEEKIAFAELTMADRLSMAEQVESYITHDVAAEEVGVHTKTLIRWIKAGELKAIKAEGERKYRILLKDWVKFKRRKGYE